MDLKQLAEEFVPSQFEGPISRARIVGLVERALFKLQQQHEAETQAVRLRNVARMDEIKAERDAAVAEALERAAGIIDARAGICNSNRLAYNDKDCPAATAWADKERMLREEAANIRALKPRSDLVSAPTHEVQRQTAWLIERGQAVRHSPTIWWRGGNVRTWPETGEDWKGQDWTEDATKARRFSSKQEAEQVAWGLFGPSVKPDWATYSITEHVFIVAAAEAADMVSVPREPTEAMIDIGLDVIQRGILEAISGRSSHNAARSSISEAYKAMLAAAEGM